MVAEVPSNLSSMGIDEIAMLIYEDWGVAAWHSDARSHLEAMSTLTSIEDSCGMDRGCMIVGYFLGNARSWRGVVARAVKKELNKRCDSAAPRR
jgi:hypothetical protein